MSSSIAVKFVLVFMFIAPVLQSQNESAQHQKEIKVWHDTRMTSLKKDYGWLTLVALDWLQEGKNDIKEIGTISLSKETITLIINNNVRATLNGKPFSSGPIKTNDDTIKIGSKAFVIIKRGEKYAVRMWDKESATRKNFNGIAGYPVSSKWKIEATWKEYQPAKKEIIPTIIPGYEEEYPVPGVAIFSINGKEYKLEPVLEEEGGDYFFIFADATNGKETYGAGRFLYATPAKNGKVVLDFNKAYNPPCAFTPFATCPLPSKANRLSLRVEAGEKKFGKH